MGKEKSDLIAEYGRLVDDQFLGNWDAMKAARLAAISASLDEADVPRISALRDEFATLEGKISQIEAKIANNGPNRPHTKTAGAP